MSKGPGQGQTRLRGRDPRVLKRVLDAVVLPKRATAPRPASMQQRRLADVADTLRETGFGGWRREVSRMPPSMAAATALSASLVVSLLVLAAIRRRKGRPCTKSER